MANVAQDALDYLLRIAPSPSVLDLAERYLSINNISNCSDGRIFYDPVGTNDSVQSKNTGIFRGIFRIEGIDFDNISSTIKTPIFKDSDIYLLYTSEQDSNTGVILSSYSYAIGVVF